ncbi:hypothetical protein [Clostridium sp. JS66]|uniref:hypothetical protein n=1 Tax=Clostridium sp. JS66 TaxID=3064705 RepID=UPI00298D9C97|nr:hypothetical protein [Clostridium sp. JS66]WPC43338.1 hypothetical protein Q6H37_07665 [Clostridium sp. JS66]
MIGLLKSEFYRIFKQKSTIVLFAFLTIVLVLVTINLKIFNQGHYNVFDAVKYSNKVFELPLNRLNMPIFILGEVESIILFILIPYMGISVVNSEIKREYLRMILIRGEEKYKVICSKVISLFLFNGIMCLFVFVLSYIISFLIYPSVSETKVFLINNSLSFGQSVVYFFKNLFIYYCVFCFVSSISTAASLAMPNPISAMFATWGILIAGMFASKFLFYIIVSLRNFGFETTAGVKSLSYLGIVIIAIFIICACSCFIFQKVDYKH